MHAHNVFVIIHDAFPFNVTFCLFNCVFIVDNGSFSDWVIMLHYGVIIILLLYSSLNSLATYLDLLWVFLYAI